MLTGRNGSRSLLIFSLIAVLLLPVVAEAQYGITFDVKKPKEYDNRVLRSEKSDQKKFGLSKRLVQNTITHYNYFFNANNKLNEVLARAKRSFHDDYTELLPFYNYTLDATAADSIQLDSISYKAQTGIVLHDLRSDWSDNMYLLWGAAYYFQKDFDSAHNMFQFINYAFAEKEDDGYYKTIGSNRDGNKATSVSTKEKNSITQKIFGEPPSRNDAFIWQIRNYLAQERYNEAGNMIVALKNDPVFPSRLRNDLEEIQAYYFYKQRNWDSAASHLEAALSAASNGQERARWEYLIAQLYERTNKPASAQEYYSKAIAHTTDPELDIYARLYSIRVNKEGGDDYINKNIESLLRMAKKDKFTDYRDLIYFMAAQMELERGNNDAALKLLQKSTNYISTLPTQRNKAFLQLAELAFSSHLYREAANYYDSIKLNDPAITNPEIIVNRKTLLQTIAFNNEVIERQDSLQKLAALPEEERDAYVKKLVKKLRKQQGLKSDETLTTGSAFASQSAPTLFGDSKAAKGEWYFYNSTSRQKGLNDFKSRWGNRPNVDNWRRSSVLQPGAITQSKGSLSPNGPLIREGMAPAPEGSTEINAENLAKKIPLTPEAMQFSNDSIQQAMLTLGVTYIQQLEDCESGTRTLEALRTRYPVNVSLSEILFNLYYCYNKNGEKQKASAIKQLMNAKFPADNRTLIVNTGVNPQDEKGAGAATKTYEHIYDLFIEGQFAAAVAEKKVADSTYGRTYWTPRLMYIESVYYIKQRQDSVAKDKLKDIITQYIGTPLGNKAAILLDVLNRRKQIEEELTNMVLTMPDPNEKRIVRSNVPVTTTKNPALPKIDSAAGKPQGQAPVINVIKPRVDSVAIKLPSKDTILTKPLRDSVVKQPVTQKPAADTVTKKPVANPVMPPPGVPYTFDPAAPIYVVVVLNKVDAIFTSEAKNAFYRYNKDNFYNKQMQAELVEIDAENKFLLISPFKNLEEALDYIDRTKPKTSSEIVPWLKNGKYYYSLISEHNLGLLRTSKDLDKYRQFLDRIVPNRF